jgi:outer membrane receptor protein involved in Fe transport
MIQKISLNILILILVSFNLLAQNKSGTVYGIVADAESDNPVPFVNVLLLKISDSSTVNAATTNKAGSFDINNVPDGDYLIKISCIGFHELIKPGIKISPAGRKLNTGTTSIYSSITDLDEVVITSKKETFNNSVDRKIYNVEQDIMSKSGTAGDLLQNIPSVSVDIDGNVSLRGNQNVMIMINGKTSPMMDKNSASVLDELPANSIERIEVLTNPSASYKPDGTSGIINIVLKKDAGTGFNSNITFNVGNKSRYNANINFNYNPGKFNIFGNYGFRQDDRERIGTDNRYQTDTAGVKSFYDENNDFHGRPFSNLATLGAEYSFNKFNKLSLTGNYFYQDAERSGVDAQVYSDANRLITEKYDRKRISSEIEKESDANLSFNHNFGQEDHDLDFEYKISRSPELQTNNYSDIFSIPSGALPQFDDDKIDQIDNKQEVTLKYKNPLSEKSSIESGYSGEFLSSDRNMYVDYFDYSVNSLVKDLGKTSDFHLDQSINALYTTYQNEIGNLGFLAGLRLESAVLKPQLVTIDTTITNKYLNLFPTLHLKYKLTDDVSLQLNYSKRVHRPRDEDLNPFPEYQDPRNVRAGNPNLLPEYTHSLEFGCQVQYENITFIPGIFYRYTNNRFTQLTSQLNDSTLLTTEFNLNNDQSGGLELVVSGSIANMFSTQVSLNGFYNQIDASNLGYYVKSSAWSWSGTLSFNFNITKTTMFQVNSNYRSLRLTPQGESAPSYAINCGMRQDLFNERVSLVLTVSDIFNTMKYKNTLDTPGLYDYSVRSRDGRIAFFGVTYHFGKSQQKKDKMEYDDSM